MVVVKACGRMLPRLEAEESLLAVQRGLVGSAALKRETASGVVREWQRTAAPAGTQPRARRLRPEMVGGLGIGYRVVTK
jgi:hypothetical protein